jgi:hypothetical protein
VRLRLLQETIEPSEIVSDSSFEQVGPPPIRSFLAQKAILASACGTKTQGDVCLAVTNLAVTGVRAAIRGGERIC